MIGGCPWGPRARRQPVPGTDNQGKGRERWGPPGYFRGPQPKQGRGRPVSASKYRAPPPHRCRAFRISRGDPPADRREGRKAQNGGVGHHCRPIAPAADRIARLKSPPAPSLWGYREGLRGGGSGGRCLLAAGASWAHGLSGSSLPSSSSPLLPVLSGCRGGSGVLEPLLPTVALLASPPPCV